MAYKVNPKTDGSKVICCIPHFGKVVYGKGLEPGVCPNKCEDCFFQSGRSYLEPLAENLPNMPSLEQAKNMIVRVNDGHDSNVKRELVLAMIEQYGYEDMFFNTAIPRDLGGFVIRGKLRPVVLTLNPAKLTDKGWHRLKDIPANLMFGRFRVNTWNLELADKAIEHYTSAGIPVVLTFMAYYQLDLPKGHEAYYDFRKRTLNSYWVITEAGWNMVTDRYRDNPLVLTCGRDAKTHACSACRNCEREYHRCLERIAKAE